MKMKFAIRCFSVAIAAVGFLLVPNLLAQPTVAGTCASNCGPQPLQFKPGQQVAVEIANRTFNLIHVQKVYGTDTVSLSPGQSLRVRQGDGTEPNVSVMIREGVRRRLTYIHCLSFNPIAIGLTGLNHPIQGSTLDVILLLGCQSSAN